MDSITSNTQFQQEIGNETSTVSSSENDFHCMENPNLQMAFLHQVIDQNEQEIINMDEDIKQLENKIQEFKELIRCHCQKGCKINNNNHQQMLNRQMTDTLRSEASSGIIDNHKSSDLTAKSCSRQLTSETSKNCVQSSAVIVTAKSSSSPQTSENSKNCVQSSAVILTAKSCSSPLTSETSKDSVQSSAVIKGLFSGITMNSKDIIRQKHSNRGRKKRM